MNRAYTKHFLLIMLLFFIRVFSSADSFAIDTINASKLSEICQQQLTTPKPVLNEDKQVIANAICVDDKIYLKGEDFVIEGDFDKEIFVTAGALTLKNCNSTKSINAQAKKIDVSENGVICNANLKLVAEEEVTIPATKIKAGEQFVITGKKINNAGKIETDSFIVNAGEYLSNANTSVINAKKLVSLTSTNEIINRGVITSAEDVTINAKSILNGSGSKIFANGVLRNKADSLKDYSQTIARVAAFYFTLESSFESDYTIVTNSALVTGGDIKASKNASFYIERNLTFSLTDLPNSSGINFAGKIRLSQMLDRSSIESFVDKWVESNAWTLSPDILKKHSASDSIRNQKMGVYVNSPGAVKGKSLSIISNQPILIKGKYVDISGTVETQIVASTKLLIQSEVGKIDGQMKSAGDLIVNAKEQLMVSGNLFAQQGLALSSDNGSVHVDNATIGGSTVSIIAKDDVAIRDSTLSGDKVLISAKDLHLRNTISNVNFSEYQAAEIEFEGFTKHKNLLIQNADAVTFSGESSSSVNSITINSSKVEIKDGANVSAKSMYADSDLIKIDGAIRALGQIRLKGKAIEHNGVIGGVGNIGMFGEVINMSGDIKTNGDVAISGDHLATTSDSSVRAGNISLNFDDKTIASIDGTFNAGGWLMFDGDLSSNELSKVLAAGKQFKTKDLRVFTTAPIIIDHNIVRKGDISLSGQSVEVKEGTSVTADKIALEAKKGSVVLNKDTLINGRDSVFIHAAKNIERKAGGDNSESARETSIITSGAGGIRLIADGKYIQRGGVTESKGTIVVRGEKGVFIVPVIQRTVRVETHRHLFGTDTTTIVDYLHHGATFKGKKLFIQGTTDSNLTNLKIVVPDESRDVGIGTPDGKAITLQEIANLSTSSTSRSYSISAFKPIDNLGRDVADGGRVVGRAIRSTVKLANSLEKSITKPLTQNISVIKKYNDRLLQLSSSVGNFHAAVLDGKQVLSLGTYKNVYDEVKKVAVETIYDAKKINDKLISKVAQEALSKVSKDLERLVLKTNHTGDKVISVADAVTSFENVMRITLVAAGTAMCGGNPVCASGASAFANVLADKYIDRKNMTREQMVKSIAIAMAASAASTAVEGTAKAAGATSTVSSAAGGATQNIVRDLGQYIADSKEHYNSTQFLASFISGAASAALKNEIAISDSAISKNDILNQLTTGAVEAAINDLSNQVVIDSRLNGDELFDEALQGAANQLVTDQISAHVKSAVADRMASFKEALDELIANYGLVSDEEAMVESEQAEQSLLMRELGLNDQERVKLESFINKNAEEISNVVAQQIFGKNANELTVDEKMSDSYQQGMVCRLTELTLLPDENGGLSDISQKLATYLNNNKPGGSGGREIAALPVALIVGIAMAALTIKEMMIDGPKEIPITDEQKRDPNYAKLEGGAVAETISPLELIATSVSFFKLGISAPGAVKEFILSIKESGVTSLRGIKQVTESAAKSGIKTSEAVKDFVDSIKRFAGNEIGAIGDIEKLTESAAELGSKADFLLGKATGATHNIERSQAMLKQFEKVGLFDNPETRAILKNNLIKTLKDPTSITKPLDGGRLLRESLISGPNGHLKIESIWEENKLITAIIKG